MRHRTRGRPLCCRSPKQGPRRPQGSGRRTHSPRLRISQPKVEVRGKVEAKAKVEAPRHRCRIWTRNCRTLDPHGRPLRLTCCSRFQASLFWRGTPGHTEITGPRRCSSMSSRRTRASGQSTRCSFLTALSRQSSPTCSGRRQTLNLQRARCVCVLAVLWMKRCGVLWTPMLTCVASP